MSGSARSDGNTAAVVRRLLDALPAGRLIELGALTIAPFDYEALQRGDDFDVLVEGLLAHPSVVFA